MNSLVAQPANDNFANAINISGIINSCSADAAYTTLGATADLNAGSCWNTAPNYNVWFKFVATTANMKITIDRGGIKGTIQRINAALWQSNGTTQIACKIYINDADDVILEVVNTLTPGNTYYISVDNNFSGYRGTFTLCLEDNNISYDFYEGALDITSLINGCSPDAAYTTFGMTGDKNPGSCWNTAPNYNVWFKFTATTPHMKITIDRGGTKGTIQRINVALWQSNGTTQIACKIYINDADDVILEVVNTLTPGNTYYLSVDNNFNGYRGTFTLCLQDNNISYDFYEGALDVTSLINGCSADAAYTTFGMTGDKNPGSCWNTAPNYNVWFKFTATTPHMKITISRGGTKGTIQRINAALWQSNGTTQVACKQYINDADNVILEVVNTLTPGNTYYISVDNNFSGYRGTFTLCLQDNNISYDFYEGALDITSLINGCSADAAYTTFGMTGDKNPGSCWNTAPNYNVWFKFTATTPHMKITISRGGTKGTIQRINSALWQSDGITQIACQRYINDADNLILEVVNTLTPGNTYYISIDNNFNGYRGTFTLCLQDNNISYDYYEGALDVTSMINGCSADAAYTTYGMTPDKNPGSCWNTAPNYNVWFKFTASTPHMKITISRGGTKGTIQRINTALWQSNGTTQIACKIYINDADNVILEVVNTLTPGNTYYISIDNNFNGYRGTFTLCLQDNNISFDYYEGALLLSDIHNWCSSDAAYTTYAMTRDKNPGSCWNTAPNYNVWFKFVATTSFVNISVKRGGSLGTIQRINAALWQSNGTTQVSCNIYINDADNVFIGAINLVPGNTYYISVDNNFSGYRGTFTLCVDDQPDYDFYDGATELTDLDNWCSPDAAYTTMGATADKNAAACWNTAPNYNRWFKFTAISANASIDVKRGGTQGTIQRINMALWAANGTTQIACKRYVADNDNVNIAVASLVPGNVYYISVDNNFSGYRGTFTLCINNIDEVYYSINSGFWNNSNNWSKIGYGGAPAAGYPGTGDVANIQGFNITLNSTNDIAELNMNAATAATSLTIDGATLTVMGKAGMTNTGNNVDVNLIVQNNGSYVVKDIATYSRGGGANVFAMTVGSGCTVNINKDMKWISTGGTVNTNQLTLNNNAQLTIGNDLILNYSAGMKIIHIFNTTSVLTVIRDITFIANADNRTEIQLNNSAQLNIGRNFSRGAPAYGLLNCNNSSTVSYNGATYLQNMASSNGSGTGDLFTYQNVIISNTRITNPQVTLSGPATINGNFTMTNGILLTSSANLISLTPATTVNAGSGTSYVDGPVKKTGNADIIFPTGDGVVWAPVGLAGMTGDAATVFTAEYHFTTYSDVTHIKNPDPNGAMSNVSTLEYWDLANTGTSSAADVTLYWKNQAGSQINVYADLRVAHYTGTQWENLGQSSIVSSDPGSITVNNISSFSPITFGSMSSTSNPLPVRFLTFEAEVLRDSVLLNWTTAFEINNDEFIIERSLSGLDAFENIGSLKGAGNSNSDLYYDFTDRNPIEGKLYYRIKQVDFNGNSDYSKMLVVQFDRISGNPFFVFPNPVPRGGEISIIINRRSMDKDINVQITSSNGVRLFDRKLVTNKSSLRLKVPDRIGPGIYIIILNLGDISVAKKIMIE